MYAPRPDRCNSQGRIQILERGVHFAEKLKTKKKKKKMVDNNNSCPLPSVYTIKHIKILIQNLIYSFIVKLHFLMNTVTALLE